MHSDELCRLTLHEAAELVRKKQVSPVELTRACLDRIEREDKNLNSFISVFGDEALAQAGEAALEISRNGWRGPLHGIPIAIKDLIDMRGKVTTAASAVLEQNLATEDAEVVKRLRTAGAVFIGKNNLHEFAYGGSGVVSHYGPPRNPMDPTRITGGSSSGSAAAVAAGFCFAAIGTDTAGSIRLPAACCGVVGLKPGYGEVSANGVLPLSWSYDFVGPLARTVEDAFLVLQAISDWTPQETDIRGLRIGIARNYFFADVDSEIAGAVERAVSSLASRCSSVQEITVPIDEDRTVFSSEAWQFHEKWVRGRPELYQPHTLARIKTGEKYAPALVEEKRRELLAMRAKAAELFRDVNVIVTPTAPIIPPTFLELEDSPESLRPKELLMLRNTRPWNVLGVPAISIPCGRMMGVQLAALSENTLWAAARAIQTVD